MTPTADLTPGSVFGGYRIERLLGRGGMGAVYAAEQLEDGRHVAVKVLSSGLGSAEDRERFIREGRTAASINHPNTVYVYRTEEIDGLPTITMELVDSGTLEEKVERRGPLPTAEAIADTLQIVDGLEAAQRLGILHRDIKPANCFVGPTGDVKVGDFGLSRPVDQVDQARLTQTGLFLGTPVFSSPEQLMGEALDLRSDIYAVGATLYFLLSGHLPYDADNAVRLIAMVMSGTPQPLVQRRPDVPHAVNALVMRCLARKRDDRFTDYAALRAALVACLPEDVVAAPLVRRVAAGIADGYVVGVLATPILLMVSKRMGIAAADVATSPRGQALQIVIELPIALLWYALIEGRWGRSPGKWLLDLRVMRADGGVPGVARGAVRGLLISLPGYVALLASLAVTGAAAKAWTMQVVNLILLGALFARARRANGFLAEHDRVTGTRVVLRKKVAARAHVANAGVLATVAPTPGGERIGPYDIVDRVASPADVLAGYDPELRRSIWIVRQRDGAEPVAPASRQMVRSTCARWIGGRRKTADNWDAYAAVEGRALVERLKHATSWTDVQGWLADLVDELRAREDSRGELKRLSVGHVWITTEERAMLLPFATGDGIAAASEVRTLLQQIATAIGAADERLLQRDAWPLRARAILSVMATDAPDLAALHAALLEAGEQTAVMSRRRRLTLWAAISVPLLLMALLSTLVGNAAVHNDPDQLRMEPLLGYLANKKNRADSLAPKRELVSVYVAGHFRRAITTTDRTGRTVLNAKEWTRADSIVKAHPTVSVESLREADRLVDSTWHGAPPSELRRNQLMPAFVVVGFVILAAMFSLGAAVVARRGLPMRILALEIVTRRGEPASRLRLLWRQMLIWLPLAAVSLAPLTIISGGASRSIMVAVIVSLVIVAVSVLTALRTPGRGLTERLSGTTIVPE